MSLTVSTFGNLMNVIVNCLLIKYTQYINLSCIGKQTVLIAGSNTSRKMRFSFSPQVDAKSTCALFTRFPNLRRVKNMVIHEARRDETKQLVLTASFKTRFGVTIIALHRSRKTAFRFSGDTWSHPLIDLL